MYFLLLGRTDHSSHMTLALYPKRWTRPAVHLSDIPIASAATAVRVVWVSNSFAVVARFLLSFLMAVKLLHHLFPHP